MPSAFPQDRKSRSLVGLGARLALFAGPACMAATGILASIAIHRLWAAWQTAVFESAFRTTGLVASEIDGAMKLVPNCFPFSVCRAATAMAAISVVSRGMGALTSEVTQVEDATAPEGANGSLFARALQDEPETLLRMVGAFRPATGGLAYHRFAE